MKARKHRSECRRIARRGRSARPHQSDQCYRASKKYHAYYTDQHRAKRVHEAAERRAANHRGLVGGGPGGNRARDEGRRHQCGCKRVRGRHLERARTPDDEDCGKQQIAAQRTSKQCGGYHDCGQRVDTVCRAHNQPPVIAVCGVADQQRENHRRHELDEPHKAKVQSAVGDFVDLPADCEGQHLVAHRRGEPGQPEQHERALLRQTSRRCGLIAHSTVPLSALRLTFCWPSAVKLSGDSQRSKLSLRCGHSLSSIE